MNLTNTGFLRQKYNTEVLALVMDERDFQAVIDNASRVVEKVYSEKRLSENQGILNFKVFLSLIAFITVFAFLAIFYIAIKNNNIDLQNTSYGLLSGGFLIMTCLSFFEAARESHNYIFRYNNKLREALQDYCEMMNAIYTERGATWNFNDTDKSLECRVVI